MMPPKMLVAALIVWVVATLASLVILGTAIYAAVHFLSKYW